MTESRTGNQKVRVIENSALQFSEMIRCANTLEREEMNKVAREGIAKIARLRMMGKNGGSLGSNREALSQHHVASANRTRVLQDRQRTGRRGALTVFG